MARVPIRLAVAFSLWLGACCAASRTPPREPEAAAPGPPASALEPAAPAADPPEAAGPEAPAPEPAAPDPAALPSAPPAPTACAEVHIGLDLRALPRGTSPNGIDMFVRGEASDLAEEVPTGAPPEIRTMPGAGLFDAVFRGTMQADELARCERTVAAYLATAPRLPILMQPAAQVITACRPCPPP